MDLRLKIYILEANGLESLGQSGDDRANILEVLGSGAYCLAGSEYKKSSIGGLDSVDESRKLLLVILGAFKLASILGRSNSSASLVDATTFTISIVDSMRKYLQTPLYKVPHCDLDAYARKHGPVKYMI